MNQLQAFSRIRPRMHLLSFIVVVTLLNALLFHYPLFHYSIGNLDIDSSTRILNFLLLFSIVFFTSLFVWSVVSILHFRLLVPALFVTFIANAVALYFIDTYHVFLDKTMMGNVFATNYNEVADLLSVKLVFYVFAFGVLPSVLITRINVVPVNRIFILCFLLLMTGLFSVVVYVLAPRWLWLDRNAKQLGAMVLPWSYLVNAGRYVHEQGLQQASLVSLPSAHIINEDRALVFLVIGESARRQNFSVYGYAKPTNQRLLESGYIALNGVNSCATYTTAALACILSHESSQSTIFRRYEILPSYLQRHGVDVIWRTNNWGEASMTVGSYLRADSLRRECKSNDCEFDGVLLSGLAEQIRSSKSRKIFVVLHQSGSHGPIYAEKYPPQFEKFRPVCRTTDLSRCIESELFNAYDNSIYYTDHFIGQVTDIAKLFPQFQPILIYISDHGESLGELGLFLHGAPSAVAPKVQTEIPFVLWMSEEFQRKRLISFNTLNELSGLSQGSVFHTIVGAFHMRSSIYKEHEDIFARVDKNGATDKQKVKTRVE